jgi:hypothetical protein
VTRSRANSGAVSRGTSYGERALSDLKKDSAPASGEEAEALLQLVPDAVRGRKGLVLHASRAATVAEAVETALGGGGGGGVGWRPFSLVVLGLGVPGDEEEDAASARMATAVLAACAAQGVSALLVRGAKGR